ncbi:MAG: mercury(II) reductase, partial [Thermomicrobium sp.]
GHRLLTGFAPAAAIARERVNFQPHGGVLVLADRESGRLLGVQAVASAAGELIDAAVLAIAHRLTLADLREHLAPYLTCAEGLRLAALAASQDIARLSCCA